MKNLFISSVRQDALSFKLVWLKSTNALHLYVPNCVPFVQTISLHVSATLTHFLWLGSQAASLQVGLQVASHLHNMVTQKWHHHKNLVWNVDMRVWRGWRRYYCLLMCEERISEAVRGIATNTVNTGTQYYIYIYWDTMYGRLICPMCWDSACIYIYIEIQCMYNVYIYIYIYMGQTEGELCVQ